MDSRVCLPASSAVLFGIMSILNSFQGNPSLPPEDVGHILKKTQEEEEEEVYHRTSNGNNQAQRDRQITRAWESCIIESSIEGRGGGGDNSSSSLPLFLSLFLLLSLLVRVHAMSPLHPKQEHHQAHDVGNLLRGHAHHGSEGEDHTQASF